MAKAPKDTLKISLSGVISRSQMGAAIESVKLEGKKLDQSIQCVLVSGAIHAHVHGDYDILNQVVGALSAGLRTNAARDWILDFAPVKWDKKKKEFVWSASKRIENIVTGTDSDTYAEVAETKAKLDAMLSTDWLSYRPERDFTPVNTVDKLESFITSLGKKIGKGEDGVMHDVHQEDLDLLGAALAQIKANAGRRALEVQADAVDAAQDAEIERLIAEEAAQGE
ncbi:MAG: hypothetical protein ACRC0G_03945 [Fusobacteriaceae bacterium]